MGRAGWAGGRRSVQTGGVPSRALEAARAEERRLRSLRRRLGGLALLCFLAPAARTGIGRFVPELAPRADWLWLEVTVVGLVIGAATCWMAHRQRVIARLADLRGEIFTLEFLRDTLEDPLCAESLVRIEHPYRHAAKVAAGERPPPPPPLGLAMPPGQAPSNDAAPDRPPLRVILGTVEDPVEARGHRGSRS